MHEGAYTPKMSPEDQHVIDVLTFFFPNDAPPQSISEEVRNLAAKMLYEAMNASKAIDFLPRPPASIPTASWLVSQAVQIAWRRAGKQKIYEMVRTTVALKYRSEYELIKLGI
jgi:hypothetical protein